MSHTIHLSNNSDQEIECIVMPEGTWVLADVLSAAAMMFFNGLGIIKTVSDLVRIYRTVAMGSWSIDFAKSIGKFFEENATKIPKGEVKEVYSTTMANPLAYFSPSKWASLFGGSNMTLMLRTKDGEYVCTLDTNDDYSWIVQNKQGGYEAVRAKYGSLWQPDPAEGEYDFSAVKVA